MLMMMMIMEGASLSLFRSFTTTISFVLFFTFFLPLAGPSSTFAFPAVCTEYACYYVLHAPWQAEAAACGTSSAAVG